MSSPTECSNITRVDISDCFSQLSAKKSFSTTLTTNSSSGSDLETAAEDYRDSWKRISSVCEEDGEEEEQSLKKRQPLINKANNNNSSVQKHDQNGVDTKRSR